MKQEFIKFLNALMAASPNVTETLMTENIKTYIATLTEEAVKSESLTENGEKVLKGAQEFGSLTFKARDIADNLGVPTKTISGALRKLTTDGYCEKICIDPVIYVLTEKGKNYKFN